jgi:hypothetical protein
MIKKIGFCTILVSFIIVFACSKGDEIIAVDSIPSIASLSCNTTAFSVNATAGQPIITTATLPYTGGNGLAFPTGMTINSTGVLGLTATLTANTLAVGAGNLIFAISGTPSSSGTASFIVGFGGQSCTLSLEVGSSNSSSGTGIGITTDVAKIVSLAEGFKATLSSVQIASLQLGYSKSNAVRWSNLPESLYKNRVGLATSSLSASQMASFKTLLAAAMGTDANEGNLEMLGILAADDYLRANGGDSGYGSGNYYIAFLGTPSLNGLWEFQFGGHHGTFANTYNLGKLVGATPSFRSTEPFPSFTQAGVMYQPIVQELDALSAILKGLSSTDQVIAKRSTSQNDIQLGPGKDGVFPNTKTGLKVGNLTAAQKALVLSAIKTYVSDLDKISADAIMAKYSSEIDNTYISFTGTTALTEKGDYILIDGPSVWIEFSMQGGIIIKNANHPHSVWRDRTGDYGGN